MPVALAKMLTSNQAFLLTCLWTSEKKTSPASLFSLGAIYQGGGGGSGLCVCVHEHVCGMCVDVCGHEHVCGICIWMYMARNTCVAYCVDVCGHEHVCGICVWMFKTMNTCVVYVCLRTVVFSHYPAYSLETGSVTETGVRLEGSQAPAIFLYLLA